jgi:hypothetical protein
MTSAAPPAAASVRPLEVVLIEDNPGEATLVEESIGRNEPQRFSVVRFSRLSAAMDHLDRSGASRPAGASPYRSKSS